jgi:hypothetical protein
VEELVFLSCLWNVHNISDVRQIDVHRAEPLVNAPVVLRSKLLLQLKKYNSRGSDNILAELIQAGGDPQTH